MWSFTTLCKLIISDDSGKLSPFSSEASLPLHDVLLLGKPSHNEWDIKRHSSFQVILKEICIILYSRSISRKKKFANHPPVG